MVTYTLIDFSNFITKHYKDYDYPKQTLKIYFEGLPFHEDLFLNYLYFLRNYENKDGYYDELMKVIEQGLSKGKRELSDKDYQRIVKVVRQYLREVLASVYLIKLSDRKVLEIEK